MLYLNTVSIKLPLLLLPLPDFVKLLLLFHEINKGNVDLVWSSILFWFCRRCSCRGQTNSFWHIDSFEGDCNRNNNIPNKMHW